MTFFRYYGVPESEATDRTIPPDGSSWIYSSRRSISHCVVEVVRGGKQNARVSLVTLDSDTTPLAAVSGN